MSELPDGPRFLIDPDGAELTIHVPRQLASVGWEALLQRLEHYVAVVDLVVLDGRGWGSSVGRRIELLLREKLPEQGVAVMHADDPRLATFRETEMPRRRPPRRNGRSPSAF